ncbi:hypothetical protein RRG08_046575 [Elysia crispata]|uniref:Uncharacterized protein n=1 Tax=Elysia crispata TaxID=231223 RepID=A0AAE1AP47_9GAST|nr:hypothetical protein RRG08_046575 [Elysia crispata]
MTHGPRQGVVSIMMISLLLQTWWAVHSAQPVSPSHLPSAKLDGHQATKHRTNVPLGDLTLIPHVPLGPYYSTKTPSVGVDMSLSTTPDIEPALRSGWHAKTLSINTLDFQKEYLTEQLVDEFSVATHGYSDSKQKISSENRITLSDKSGQNEPHDHLLGLDISSTSESLPMHIDPTFSKHFKNILNKFETRKDKYGNETTLVTPGKTYTRNQRGNMVTTNEDRSTFLNVLSRTNLGSNSYSAAVSKVLYGRRVRNLSRFLDKGYQDTTRGHNSSRLLNKGYQDTTRGHNLSLLLDKGYQNTNGNQTSAKDIRPNPNEIAKIAAASALNSLRKLNQTLSKLRSTKAFLPPVFFPPLCKDQDGRRSAPNSPHGKPSPVSKRSVRSRDVVLGDYNDVDSYLPTATEHGTVNTDIIPGKQLDVFPLYRLFTNPTHSVDSIDENNNNYGGKESQQENIVSAMGDKEKLLFDYFLSLEDQWKPSVEQRLPVQVDVGPGSDLDQALQSDQARLVYTVLIPRVSASTRPAKRSRGGRRRRPATRNWTRREYR